MDKQQLALDGASYVIFLPDAATDYIQGKIASAKEPYELDMLRDMASRLEKGDLVLDVGANIGNHSLYLASIVGCRVEAFEPNQNLCEALQASIALNALEERVVVHQVGVSEAQGFAHFDHDHVDASNLGGQSLEVSQSPDEITLVSLDQLDLPAPLRMIKIDVEGMELQVLRGAKNLIERDRPILYVEGKTENDFSSINNLLKELGYLFCSTFNATPTHLFLHHSEFSGLAEAGRYLEEKVHFSYRANHAISELCAKLENSNLKYRELNERYADIKKRYEEANLKYREVTAKTATMKSEIARLSLSLREAELDKEKLHASKDLELERAALDFEREKMRHQTQIERLSLDKGHAEQARNQLHEQLQSVRKELAALNAAHSELRARKQARLQELQQANGKYRQLTSETIPTLKQKLDAQTQRTAELYQRTEQLNQELKQARQLQAAAQRALSSIKSSATYKAGLHVRAASSSISAALKLPIRLWRLRKLNPQTQAEAAFLPATSQLAPAAVDRKTLFTECLENKPASQVRVACIMDDFTFGSYQPECDLHQLTPDGWQAELEACQPELLFIESAWRGKDELWGSKVGHCSQELQGIVAWCRERHVPTVFWNKEDPVHFETFLTTAKLFDFVFTTDMDCIHRYKAALGHERVFFLPFACQPSVHNPIEKYIRKDAFCFAGAYYLRYPERTRDLESFVQELPAYRPLEIYDRNFGKDDPSYQFPKAYQPYIVGTLPFAEIDKAYKGYRYAINLNSIKQSQTMFARRVFELLGSNTLTVSNFSRGVRLMFGDLVLTSDSGEEIKRRLQQLQSGNQVDRLRLAGLRKVMAEHTYADRLNYMLQQVIGKARPAKLTPFTVLASVKTLVDVKSIAAHVARQQGVELSLVLVIRRGLSMTEAEAALKDLPCPYTLLPAKFLRHKNLLELTGSDQHWIAGMVPDDYYGPHYLLDMALATRYSKKSVIGKAARHICTLNNGAPHITLNNAAEAYIPANHLYARCSVIAPEVAKSIRSDKWLAALADWQYDQPEQLSIDPYHYCQNVRSEHWPQVADEVDDLPVDTGVELASLTQLAENIEAMENGATKAPSLNGNQLAQLLLGKGLNHDAQSTLALPDGPIKLTRNKSIHPGITGATLDLESSLPDGKHEYLYATNVIEVAAVSCLVDGQQSIPMHLEVDPGLNLNLVVLFLDGNKERLGHQMLLPNRNVKLDIPVDAEFLRFGLRVYAGGSTRVKRLMFGHLDLEPAKILGQSDVLLLTNHYPSYDDLYRNGFVHSRVKGYAERGVPVDVFRLRKDEPISWHEFQNVDVTTGSQQALRRMLQSGCYRHVLVHFLDPDMWQVLKDFVECIKITVWVHGADIQPWHRRKFLVDTLEQEKIAIELSDKRMSFWRDIVSSIHPNLELVFVSNYLAEEVMEDLGFRLPVNQYHIIHNPINTELFKYQEKDPALRKKILSIRSYASRVYANDLTVKCIIKLSEEPFFNELEFRLIGDGKLFDETVYPLRKFKNVIIEKKFLTQQEIAELHKEFGIFLCPSRMDTQGVSRDEAMSSGLVPVTSNVAAIPEFVGSECGIVASPESYVEMADGISKLYHSPDYFLGCSFSSSQSARRNVDQELVIKKEVLLFSDGMLGL
ncbi:FkbM family methyltransferase [Halomonas campisalis]|uniref:FkbM family methyltransferase n=1 Tax=Billgrantia campisalis TaxID=74661 RepID=A0ABS9P8E8_9GAMM|nr:FkbM family methyltransferase [Halomonas campisalis]MCG6658048.1 FkbM family methyltransferase [Halomonas campisalis]MDR5862714.1 FkbM family methyltransferase [Halomonas campisalis]